MNKQQLEDVLNNAPIEATHYCNEESLYWDICLANDHHRVFLEPDYTGDEEWFSTDDEPSVLCTEKLSDLRNQLALIEENEKLKAALLTVANWQDSDKEQVGFCIEVLKELSND